MAQDFEDMRLTHEVDQALAESISYGYMRAVGQRDGENTYELTSKGMLVAAIMHIQVYQVVADNEQRDFNQEEKAEILEHLKFVMKALKRR